MVRICSGFVGRFDVDECCVFKVEEVSFGLESEGIICWEDFVKCVFLEYEIDVGSSFGMK